jgi:hypothetical protein
MLSLGILYKDGKLPRVRDLALVRIELGTGLAAIELRLARVDGSCIFSVYRYQFYCSTAQKQNEHVLVPRSSNIRPV